MADTMTMRDKYIVKSGYGVNRWNPETIEVADVFAVIAMVKDDKVPDGSCSDTMCQIWSAVCSAVDKAVEKERSSHGRENNQ